MLSVLLGLVLPSARSSPRSAWRSWTEMRSLASRSTKVAFLSGVPSHCGARWLAIARGGTRVPFTLTWPRRLVPGSSYRAPASSLELTPTLLVAVGARAAADLLPILSDVSATRTSISSGLIAERVFQRRDCKWLTTGELIDLRVDVRRAQRSHRRARSQ